MKAIIKFKSKVYSEDIESVEIKEISFKDVLKILILREIKIENGRDKNRKWQR